MTSNAQRATRNAQPVVGLAVSGHGFGHAVRCAEVASALLARGVRVKIRTDAPAWLFPAQAEFLPSPGWPLDVGVAQYDGLELDIDETRRRWQAFACELEARARAEADLVEAHRVDVLVGDIPPLGFAAEPVLQRLELILDGVEVGTRNAEPGTRNDRLWSEHAEHTPPDGRLIQERAVTQAAGPADLCGHLQIRR